MTQPNMFFHVKFQKINDYITHVILVGQPFAYCILATAATILTFDQGTGFVIASSTIEYNDDFEYEYENETIVDIPSMMGLWLENMKPNGITDLRMMDMEDFYVFYLTREIFDNVVNRTCVLDALISCNASLPTDITLEIYCRVQDLEKQDIKKYISSAILNGFPFLVQVLITKKGWFTYQIMDDMCMAKNDVLYNRCFWWKACRLESDFCYCLEHSGTQ